MLKIVYPICCGMDVHKSFIVACIATTNDHGVTTYKSKRFSAFAGDLRRCAAWLSILLYHIFPFASMDSGIFGAAPVSPNAERTRGAWA